MCNIKAEEAGEIRFAARDVESTAYLEVEGEPIFFPPHIIKLKWHIINFLSF